MTRDEVIALGIDSQRAQEIFRMLCQENTKTDPAERAKQVERFEKARADMHAAMNAHHRALGLL